MFCSRPSKNVQKPLWERLKHSLAQLELRMIQGKKDIENPEIIIQAKVL